MKKAKCYLILFVFIPVLMGMGSFNMTGPVDTIPVPEKSFQATFVDTMGVATTCSNVSIDGEVFVHGKRGKGVYTIPFDIVTEIVFRKQGSRVMASIHTISGGMEDVIVDEALTVFGKTQYGTFTINIEDLKKIIIAP